MKYSELKTSDVLNDKRVSKNKATQELSLYASLTGEDINVGNHPIVNIAYLFRKIYATFNEEFSIDKFENKYLQVFQDSDSHVWDILNIYTRQGSEPNTDVKNKGIKTALDDITAILSKIGKIIRVDSIEKSISAYDDIDFKLTTRIKGTWQDKPIINFMYLVHRQSSNKKYYFKGFIFNLLSIMFSYEGYPKEYMSKFLQISGFDADNILKSLNTQNPSFSFLDTTRSIDTTMGGDYRNKFYKELDSFWDDDSKEAVENFTMGIQTLFYIKGYLDYTYKRYVNNSHERVSLKFGKGVNERKVKESSNKIKIVASKSRTPKFSGTFGGDTGTKSLSKKRGSSQEVANMQITLAALIADQIPDNKLDNMVEGDDIRFINSIEEIKDIKTKDVKMGKTFKLDSKLNDGIFGFRTKKLVELYQKFFKESPKVPEEVKNEMVVNGVYDAPTRKATEHLINTHFNKIAEVQKTEVTPTKKEFSFFTNEPKKKNKELVKDIIIKDNTLLDSFKKMSNDEQKVYLSTLASTIDGLPEDSVKIVVSNSLSGTNNNLANDDKSDDTTTT